MIDFNSSCASFINPSDDFIIKEQMSILITRSGQGESVQATPPAAVNKLKFTKTSLRAQIQEERILMSSFFDRLAGRGR